MIILINYLECIDLELSLRGYDSKIIDVVLKAVRALEEAMVIVDQYKDIDTEEEEIDFYSVFEDFESDLEKVQRRIYYMVKHMGSIEENA